MNLPVGSSQNLDAILVPLPIRCRKITLQSKGAHNLQNNPSGTGKVLQSLVMLRAMFLAAVIARGKGNGNNSHKNGNNNDNNNGY